MKINHDEKVIFFLSWWSYPKPFFLKLPKTVIICYSTRPTTDLLDHFSGVVWLWNTVIIPLNLIVDFDSYFSYKSDLWFRKIILNIYIITYTIHTDTTVYYIYLYPQEKINCIYDQYHKLISFNFAYGCFFSNFHKLLPLAASATYWHTLHMQTYYTVRAPA